MTPESNQQRNSMSYVSTARRSFYTCLMLLALCGGLAATASAQNFYVQGRQLFDECGEAVTLRGVNKMAVWTNQDPTGVTIFPEIRKTGANVVRIVWLTDWSGNPNATLANLDAVIQNCRDNQMIPMIELHDATGDWSQLNNLVTFWTRPDVVAILNKHQRYLLVNIGNEIGDYNVTDAQFKSGYSAAVTAIRNAGIKVPLVIDAAGYGQEINYILNNAPALIAADPQHNLIFSLHVWWHYHGANAASDFVNAVDAVVAANIPFIVGEFAGVCQLCDNINNDSPYDTILTKSQQASIGWIAWEWGPGNEYGNPSCPAMNMTTDGQYTNIQAGWARSVAIDHPYSIKNTAVTPKSIANGSCATADFSVTATPTQSISPGDVATFTFTLQSLNGFSSPVSLSALYAGQPLPANLWSAQSVTPAPNGSSTSTLTIATDFSTPTGTYPLTLRATGGGLTREVNVQLTVATRVDSMLDQQAKQDMTKRAAGDLRFGGAIAGAFVKYLGWQPEWELRAMAFNFSGGRVVVIYHITNKADTTKRATIFFDPDAGAWGNWVPAS